MRALEQVFDAVVMLTVLLGVFCGAPRVWCWIDHPARTRHRRPGQER
jgi:hypothetical protein